jgi:hypothetical protein
MNEVEKKRREIYAEQHEKAHKLAEAVTNLLVRAGLRDEEMSLGTLLVASQMAQTALLTFMGRENMDPLVAGSLIHQGTQCGEENTPLFEMHAEELLAYDNKIAQELNALAEKSAPSEQDAGLSEDEKVINTVLESIGLPKLGEVRMWLAGDGRQEPDEEEEIFPTMKGGDA